MTKFLNNADLQKTELRNAVIQNLDDFPANPKQGQVFYLAPAKAIYEFDGSYWLPTKFSYKGNFNSSTQYRNQDVVSYNGGLYSVKPSGTVLAIGTLPTVNTSWDLLAEAGISSTYTNATPTPVAVGGVPAGHTFSAESVNQIFNELFYPYLSPGFSSFGITYQSAQVEVGTTISGTKTFTWTTYNSSNVQPNSIQILQGSTVLGSGLATSGTISVPITTVTNSSPASQSWTIKGTNTNGVQFSSTFTVTWYLYRYSGTSNSTTLTGAGVRALATGALATSGSGAGTYTFAAGGYKYIAVSTAFPALSTIKDASNNLPMAMADSTSDPAYSNTANGWSFALVNVTNDLGVTSLYRIYRSQNILGGTYQIVTT